MRRHHVRLLANCARLGLLGICCAAGGTAAIWTWRPQWVADFDAHIFHDRVQVYFDRLDAINALTDAAQKEQGYQALLNDLPELKRQDWLGEVAEECWLRLSYLAEQRGDFAAARQWIGMRADFDDRDVITASRLGELECRDAAQRAAGMKRLDALNKRYPGHPLVIRALVGSLLRADQPVEASRVLDAAMQAPRSNLWTIAWNAGSGIDRQVRRIETIPVREGDEQTFRFRIAEPIVGLAIMPPAFHGGVLLRPRLECGSRTIDLTTARPDANAVRVEPGIAVTTGDGGPSLAASWDEPIPAGTPLVLRWREAPMLEFAFASTLTQREFDWIDTAPERGDPDLVRRLRTYRARAAAAGQWQVFWCGPQQDFSGAHQTLQTLLPVPDAEGATFKTTFAVGDEIERLRLDLPEAVGVDYVLSQCELATADGPQAIDLATAEVLGMHNVERRDGRFHVTDTDPYFHVRLPKVTKVTTVTVAGVAR